MGDDDRAFGGVGSEAVGVIEMMVRVMRYLIGLPGARFVTSAMTAWERASLSGASMTAT